MNNPCLFYSPHCLPDQKPKYNLTAASRMQYPAHWCNCVLSAHPLHLSSPARTPTPMPPSPARCLRTRGRRAASPAPQILVWKHGAWICFGLPIKTLNTGSVRPSPHHAAMPCMTAPSSCSLRACSSSSEMLGDDRSVASSNLASRGVSSAGRMSLQVWLMCQHYRIGARPEHKA